MADGPPVLGADRIPLACLVALLVAAGPGAAVAAADDAVRCLPALARPACTILRPAPPAGPPAAAGSGPDCIVLVGGLGTRTDVEDGFFDPLVAPFAEDPRFRVVRFGVELAEIHPYDTYGAISRSGEHLRDLVEDLRRACGAVHVLAHSMGGTVADRAFSKGLSARDGVATYLPLSSPHNGATAAAAVRTGVELDEDLAAAMSWLARELGLHDPTTEAVRDLAHLTRPRPVRDVPTARLRMAHDPVVLRRDHVDRRVEAREYLPASLEEVEGHGGIARSASARDVVERTIRHRAVPAEARSAPDLVAATAASLALDRSLAELWAGVSAALVDAALLAKLASAVRSALEALREVLLIVEPLPLAVLR